MSEWVAVVQEEGDEPIEIPTESDGTILLSSLTAQFPGVTGLKFRNPETNTLRGVRCAENSLYPPSEEEGWGKCTYICNRPKVSGGGSSSGGARSAVNQIKDESALKRKSEQDPDGMSSKNQRVDDFDTDTEVPMDADESGACDLIVLGLPWKATEDDIREYFEAFGPLTMIQLKTKESGQSKGFAFIRFRDLEVQDKVLLTRHMIQQRWCDVKIPESQELKNAMKNASCKIFVARLSETISAEDLREHFEKFGPVTDVYIPKPFRSFAFVTFQESKVAQSLFGKDHLIKGISVHIGSAQPRTKSSQNHDHVGSGSGSGGGRGYGRGYDYGSGGANPWQSGNPGYSRGDHRSGHRNYYH